MRELFYAALKRYCQSALWFYFSKWQIKDNNKLPSGPIIFVANHQNAFLDAVLVSCSIPQPVWSLARAEVFEKPLARKILTWLKMMPVFRFRDGFSTLKKNDETFSACINRLANGESILIFAEGNHHDHWRLRPLQKGFARIAIAAEEKNNWQLGLHIVPIGLQYEHAHESLSRVLVKIGDPIKVATVIDQTDTLAGQLQDLVTLTTHRLEPLILNIDEKHYADKVNYLMHYRMKSKDLNEQLAMDRAVLQTFDGSENLPPAPKRHRFWNPLYTYWFLNTLVPWLLIQWVLKTKMKDPQFTSSLRFALGMILVPVFVLIQSFAIGFFFNEWWALLYFISIPVFYKIHSRLV